MYRNIMGMKTHSEIKISLPVNNFNDFQCRVEIKTLYSEKNMPNVVKPFMLASVYFFTYST